MPDRPILREGASVSLFVDGADVSLECRVLAFHRNLVVLERSRALSGQDLRSLAPGAVTYIVCGARDRLAALRVQVKDVRDDRLILQQLDRFALGQRRSFTRLQARWGVVLEGIRDDRTFAPAQSAGTLDVSAGGALVERPPGLDEYVAYRLTLELPVGDAPMVVAAQTVRATPELLALRFIGVQPVDEARIGRHILDALAAGGSSVGRSERDAMASALVHDERQTRIDAIVAGVLAER